MSVNTVYLMGRCGKDAEVRTIQGGSKVAQFSLATGSKYQTKDGHEVDDTAWHNIVAWRNLAELAEKYIKKGTQMLVVGRITYREYTDNAGNKRNVTEILADKIELCGGKQENQAPASAPVQQRPKYNTTPIVAGEPEGDDLPFN